MPDWILPYCRFVANAETCGRLVGYIDADDLVQETLLWLWKSGHTITRKLARTVLLHKLFDARYKAAGIHRPEAHKSVDVVTERWPRDGVAVWDDPAGNIWLRDALALQFEPKPAGQWTAETRAWRMRVRRKLAKLAS